MTAFVGVLFCAQEYESSGEKASICWWTVRVHLTDRNLVETLGSNVAPSSLLTSVAAGNQALDILATPICVP